MRAYTQRTGERMTYELLASRSGLSRATVESIGTRNGYNATLKVIARISGALDCPLDALLELVAPPGKPVKRLTK
jgi:putative transcriptional regulator